MEPPGRRAFQRRAEPGPLREPSRPSTLGHEDIAFLQYTGGTTGVAKGAVLTHRNLVANVLQLEALVRARAARPEQSTIVGALPLYHIFALTANACSSSSSAATTS